MRLVRIDFFFLYGMSGTLPVRLDSSCKPSDSVLDFLCFRTNRFPARIHSDVQAKKPFPSQGRAFLFYRHGIHKPASRAQAHPGEGVS